MSIDKLTRAKCDAPARANLGPKMEDKDGGHWAQELCVCLCKSMEVGSVTIGHFSVPSLIDAWRKLMGDCSRMGEDRRRLSSERNTEHARVRSSWISKGGTGEGDEEMHDVAK